MIERAMTMIDPTFRPQAAPERAMVGWVEVAAAPSVTDAARAALARADIPLRPVRLPSLAAAFTAALAIIGAEVWTAFGHLVGCERLGAEVAAAETVRAVFRAEIDAVLADVDALALPTLPNLPLSLAAAADPATALRSTSLVRQFNLTGHPAVTLPISAAGLPAGLQLVGRLRGDEALCALARTIADRLRAAGELRFG
jgi:amidase